MAAAKRRVARLDIDAYAAKAKKYVAEKNLSKRVNEEMRIYNLTMKVNRLEMLKAEIGIHLVDGFTDLDQYVSETLNGRTTDELKRQAGILGKTVSGNDTLVHSIVNASFHNATFSDRIWMHQALLKSELDKQLQQGLLAGKHPQVLARDIRKAFNVSRSDAERLMRTELARVQTDAQMRSFEENGFEWYMFLSLGSRACEVCRALNGKKFKVKDMLISENTSPMHPNCRCSTVAAMGSENKSVELQEELRSTKAIDESIKKGIRDAIEGIEKIYGYRIPEIEYAPFAENIKAPFTFIPYQQNGMYRAKLNINTLFDWDETLELFNERIYNKNYKTGILASRNMDDLILHEVARFKTFESCKTWQEFLQKEREICNRYIPGISRYNTLSYDGAETIAEGLVAIKNNRDVLQEIKELIKEYVKW